MATLAIATCGCFCCLGCGLKEVEPEDNNDDDNNNNNNNNEESRTKGKSRILFRPVLGVTTVLGMIFLPVVDLANQCGLPCCLDIPILTSTGTSFDSENDDVSEVDVEIER
jgi:hypothetical protein